ncbi:Outer membrane lipoprotein blc precursor|nr:Outer membrane lipoprotein blc precursor [Candidatus Pantoea persica]
MTATYSLREDSDLKVINRGYKPQKQKWQESVGKAYFIPATRSAPR